MRLGRTNVLFSTTDVVLTEISGLCQELLMKILWMKMKGKLRNVIHNFWELSTSKTCNPKTFMIASFERYLTTIKKALNVLVL